MPPVSGGLLKGMAMSELFQFYMFPNILLQRSQFPTSVFHSPFNFFLSLRSVVSKVLVKEKHIDINVGRGRQEELSEFAFRNLNVFDRLTG